MVDEHDRNREKGGVPTGSKMEDGVRDGWYTEKQKGERKATAFLRSLMRVT